MTKLWMVVGLLTLMSPLGAYPADDIVLDADAVRYYASGLAAVQDSKFAPLLERVQEVRLHHGDGQLDVTAKFSRATDIILKDPATTPNWKLYGVHVPALVSAHVKMDDGFITVDGLAEGRDVLYLMVKMTQFLPPEVFVHSATVDLGDGKLQIEAGVVGDLFPVVATGNINNLSFDNFDLTIGPRPAPEGPGPAAP